jgi:soluble lytic murein transglycosylase-like protein
LRDKRRRKDAVTPCKRALTLIALTILASTTLFFTAATESQAATLAAQLRTSRRDLELAKDALAHARAVPVIAPAVPGTHPPAPAANRFAIHLVKLRVRRLAARVARLEVRQRGAARAALLRRCAARGDWRPIVVVAARQNHISAAGLYRMMQLESGGRVNAQGGGGAYLGLYQYSPSTWRGSWNPWRHRSIYDGVAQIWATATAIRKGFGPHMWPNTYSAAF